MADSWRASTLAPFSSRTFLSIWSASLVSNFGSLIQAVGASWLMTSLAPSPDYVAAMYRVVSEMLEDAGLGHDEAAAGCARCQACSGLSAWERVFEKERWRELADRRAS